MAFAQFDPNNKPASDYNLDWLKLPNGEKRQKLKDDCKPFDCEVEVLEATSSMRYQSGDNSTYEYLNLTLGLIKNGQVSDVYHTVKIKGSKVINGVSNLTNRIYNIFGIASVQKPDCTKILKQIVKKDFNKNEETHDLLNMAGVHFRVIIATTGQYNGNNTYTTYFYSPSKQSYEELIAGDTSLTAFNKGIESITQKRAEFLNNNQITNGGYNGYGQNQTFGNAPAQQGFSNGANPFTSAPQNVAQMASMQGVANNVDNQPIDDDLPF